MEREQTKKACSVVVILSAAANMCGVDRVTESKDKSEMGTI